MFESSIRTNFINDYDSFETVPQVTLQGLLYLSVIEGRELTNITDQDLILSIASAIFNSVNQVYTLKLQSAAVDETFVQYSLNCIIARFVIES